MKDSDENDRKDSDRSDKIWTAVLVVILFVIFTLIARCLMT